MNLQLATTAVFAVAVLLGVVRILLGWRRGRGQVRAWRPLLLLGLQVPLALLLYCTLFPPEQSRNASSSLTVLTEGATPRDAMRARGDGTVVALPEAPSIAGVARVPDLGTALRRHPGVARIEVVGHGLVARDRDAAAGIRIVPPTSALPPGLQRLDGPVRIVMGETLVMTGQVGGIDDARVELLDPAGRRVDAVRVDEVGRFTLSAPMLAAGLVTFEVRVLEADGNVFESTRLPVSVDNAPTPRMLLLGGAPNPETRALQRWMQDAGFDVQARISLGAGMQVGNAAAALTAERLGQLDLLLVDARAWTDLGSAGRATVMRAVEQGMGLLVRADTPMPSSAWGPLRTPGFLVTAGTSAEAFRPAAPRSITADAPAGGASEPASAQPGNVPVPELMRRNVRVSGTDAVTLAQAADGTPLGGWRAHGRGRLGVWTPVDTWRLPLLGHRELHVALWNSAIEPLLRATPDEPVVFDGGMRVGERIGICGVGEGAVVQAPDAMRTDLLVDPGAAGCAAFWPRTDGWHQLHEGDAISPFFVHAIDARPAERAAALRTATLRLAARPAGPRETGGAVTRRERGSPWPWFGAWLVLAALAWALERARWGRLPDGP